MLPIIVLSRDGEILVYESLAHAEMSLEPLDVENGEYVALDATGKPVELTTFGGKKGYRPGQTRIRPSSTEAQDNETWVIQLRKTLARYGIPGSIATWATQEELLRLAMSVGERK